MIKRSINLLILLAAFGCKQTYDPPAIKNNPNLLVVDGLINGNPGGTTTFQLPRTQTLSDSIGS